MAAGSMLLCLGCGSASDPQPHTSQSPRVADKDESLPPWLQDVSDARGLAFVHDASQFDDYEMPAIMGSGGSFVDFDGDGRLDIYLVNGSRQEPNSGDGFYRQDADGRFVDVLDASGITAAEFGMGAWWGDFDGDGFPDLFLTNVGANRLFHNQGDGTFREVPLPPGVAHAAWSTAACWTDLNGNGLLDLFVVNYVDYIPGQYCEGPDGRQEFCGPSSYPGTIDRIYINTGGFDENGGVFQDETVARGLGDKRGKGLGTIARDFNGDGRVDLYVANDMEPNRLWIQRTDGTFEDRADLLGVARNFLGESEASMGIVVGDWNRDGTPDLLISHLAGETNTFYLSDAGGLWQDATAASRLGPPSLPYTGFGIAAFDFEHNGRVDFLIVNGGVKRSTSAVAGDDPRQPYAQPNQIYLRDSGDGVRFTERSDVGGDFARTSEISRALVVGDIDGDGDCDLLLINCAGPARLYENVAPNKGRWLSLRLIDTVGNREAVGARAWVVLPHDRIEREVNPYQGYLSQNDIRLHFGLGEQLDYESIEVVWPDGADETFPGGRADRRLTLIRGGGIVSDGSSGGELP